MNESVAMSEFGEVMIPVTELLGRTDACSEALLPIIVERGRQVWALGHTPESDDRYADNELARAAACYAAGTELFSAHGTVWPWAQATVPDADMPEVRRLAIAGALILAALERHVRAGADMTMAIAADVDPMILEVAGAVAGSVGMGCDGDDAAACRCIGCGCDELHACVNAFGEPCGWLRVDHVNGVGVCSQCVHLVDEWDRSAVVIGRQQTGNA